MTKIINLLILNELTNVNGKLIHSHSIFLFYRLAELEIIAKFAVESFLLMNRDVIIQYMSDSAMKSQS